MLKCEQNLIVLIASTKETCNAQLTLNFTFGAGSSVERGAMIDGNERGGRNQEQFNIGNRKET